MNDQPNHLPARHIPTTVTPTAPKTPGRAKKIALYSVGAVALLAVGAALGGGPDTTPATAPVPASTVAATTPAPVEPTVTPTTPAPVVTTPEPTPTPEPTVPPMDADVGEIIFLASLERDVPGGYTTDRTDDDILSEGQLVCARLDSGETLVAIMYERALDDIDHAGYGSMIGAAIYTLCPQHEAAIDQVTGSDL